MAKVITTSLNIDFTTTDAAAVLKVEIDSRDDGLNGGVTTFYAGDSPVFLLYKTTNVIIDSLETSEGSLQAMGASALVYDEWLTFAKVRNADLGYPCAGALTVLKQTFTPTVSLSGETQVVLSDKALGAAHVQYPVNFLPYKLVGASGTAPVVIYVTGHTQ